MSVSLLLSFILIGELALYAGLAALACMALDVSRWLILPGIVVPWCLVRTVLIAIEFRFARRWGDAIPPELQISRARQLRCMVREWLMIARSFSFLQPLAPLFARWAFDEPRRGDRPVVLLVHGLLCNASVWRSMRRTLQAAGFDVEVVNLAPIFGPIAMSVPQLDDRIEAICKLRGIDRLPVVAHSLGGLAIRAYIAAQGDARLERVITIASPHFGTHLAHFGNARNVREVRPGSSFLKALLAKERTVRSVPITCIFSYHDNIVMPQRTAVLPGSREIAYSGIGHVSLINDFGVQRQVCIELRRPQTPGI